MERYYRKSYYRVEWLGEHEWGERTWGGWPWSPNIRDCHGTRTKGRRKSTRRPLYSRYTVRDSKRKTVKYKWETLLLSPADRFCFLYWTAADTREFYVYRRTTENIPVSVSLRWQNWTLWYSSWCFQRIIHHKCHSLLPLPPSTHTHTHTRP
jgi:hypothetical protein